MTTSVSPDFEHALRFERELTERQQAVLSLVAKGLTNAEIAESLDISLDGAKWNVSEILTKLGLAAREEAADFYRWRRSRPRSLARRMRALGGLAWWKAGLGGAAATTAIGGAIAGWVFLAPAPVEGDAPGEPFYMEARVTQSVARAAGGTIIAPAGSRIVLDSNGEAMDVAERIRRWHDDPLHDRTERDLVAADGGEPYAEFRLVLDGEFAFHDTPGEMYSKSRLDLNPPDAHPNVSEPGPANADSIDALVARLAAMNDAGHAAVVGEDVVLGRKTVIVEWGPASWRMGPGGWITAPARAWVDPERMFVMRVERPHGDAQRVAEVVELRYGEDQPDERFVFAPAPGSYEMVCTGGQAHYNLDEQPGQAVEVPPRGFLHLPRVSVPAGFSSPRYGNEAEVTGGKMVCTGTTVRMTSPAVEHGFLEFRQDRKAPEVLLPIDRSDIRLIRGSRLAYVSTEPGVAIIAWLEGGLGVQLRSNVLDVAGLLEVAEALKLRE